MRAIFIVLTLVAILTTLGCHRSAGQKGDDGGLDDAIVCDKGHYSGEILIKEQSELRQWEGYTSADSLYLLCEDCTDLASLICLEYADSVTINHTYQLTSLNGLDNLESVGFILLKNNLKLKDLSALSKIRRLGINPQTEQTDGWGIEVDHNPALTTLSALSGVEEVRGWVQIVGNQLLTDVAVLSGVSEIDAGLLIFNNESLESLASLDGINHIEGDVAIQSNNSLVNLSGLESLQTLGARLHIQNNSSLTSLDGLESLETMGQKLLIAENALLADISGLSSLSQLGEGLMVRLNPSLPDCQVCELMNQVGIEEVNEYAVAGNLSDSCTPLPSGCP